MIEPTSASGDAARTQRAKMRERPQGIRAIPSLLARLWSLNKAAALSGLFLLLLMMVALSPGTFATHDPLKHSLPDRFQPPSSVHWFGTDHVGRDIYSRIVFGTRLSTSAGLIAVLVSTTLGATLGLVSGYHGGRLDDLIMRSLEILLAFPGVLLAIMIVATLGPGMENVIIALVVFSVPEMARVVRGQVLSLREQEFVLAARSVGANSWRILLRHLLPNSLSTIVVVATLRVGMNILIAAALSFIGLGVSPPTPEWGSMIAEARVYLNRAPHTVTFPGLLILLTVLAINFFGDGLNQVTNPRLRR